MTEEIPSILFVCVHNAGRSQMAAGFVQALGGGRVRVFSAGSEPADAVNPVAVAAMAEVGIDIAGRRPHILAVDDVRAADVVITMGCGDACPIFPGKRYEDWDLTDPAGRPIDEVRPVRDEIRDRVGALLAELGARPVPERARDAEKEETPGLPGVLAGGSDRRRSGDLSIFSRMEGLPACGPGVPDPRKHADLGSSEALRITGDLARLWPKCGHVES